MYISGLVSVSFREETPERIIEECVFSGLEAIEWGGDIHVPAGNIENAVRIGDLTRLAGLSVSSYGSYYTIGKGDNPDIPYFYRIMDTAEAIEAPVVRLWAGNIPSADISEEKYEKIAQESYILTMEAKRRGIRLALECHNGTLTDDYSSSLKLMKDIDSPDFRMYWQPNQFKSYEYNLISIRELAPYIENIHVFNWNKNKKYPLSEGISDWKGYLRQYASSLNSEGKITRLLLEFMHDGKISSLKETSDSLRKIID